MTVTTASPAPYAPASAILDIIDRYRSRGLPSPVTGEVLARAGISESLVPRTLQALQTLDLIDDKGMPTNTLEGLRLAPQAEFKQRLAEWLNAAYSDVMVFIDPATADEVAIRDAFRSYNPIGQQPRMVTLFQGLCSAAGIGSEKSSAPRTTKPRVSTRASGTASPAAARRPHAATPHGRRDPAPQPPVYQNGIPAPLAGLLTRLPPDGRGWTKADREKFLATFGALLDFCYPILEKNRVEDDEAAETDEVSAA